VKIGIPRGFYYFSYPALWETYFAGLGFEPVVSGRTTRKTLELATTRTESEHCLPHKIFDGHVLSLLDRVDALFIPRIISMMKGHICCPRFGALPDAVRAGIGSGHRIITAEINETKEPLAKTLVRLAQELDVSRRVARSAVEAGLAAMDRALSEEAAREHAPSDRKRFLILGHPYTLHDAFVAEPILKKLTSLGLSVERMTFEEKGFKPDLILWCTFHKMYRRLQRLDMDTYAGAIQITTFNCGTDSMMTERFRRMCRKIGVPYLLLMVDEHTGRAGVDTRLEAFVDSLAWKAQESAS